MRVRCLCCFVRPQTPKFMATLDPVYRPIGVWSLGSRIWRYTPHLLLFLLCDARELLKSLPRQLVHGQTENRLETRELRSLVFVVWCS